MLKFNIIEGLIHFTFHGIKVIYHNVLLQIAHMAASGVLCDGTFVGRALIWSREVSKPTWCAYHVSPCHTHITFNLNVSSAYAQHRYLGTTTNWAELTLRQSFLCHIFGQYTLSTKVLLNTSTLDSGAKSYISFLSFLKCFFCLFLLIFKTFYFVLEYSQLTMLW